MRILLVTGIYPPDIGGPSTYAQKMAEKLNENGHAVTIVTFSDKKEEKASDEVSPHSVRRHLGKPRPFDVVRIVRGNRILNRIRFFFAAYRLALKCDLIYSLDWFAAGLPVAIAARMRRRPYVIRVGGDYLWEQRYLESGEKPIPLADFYEHGIYLRKKYALFYRVIRFVFSRASHVIFNSDKQRELYIRFWGLSQEHTSTIFNPVPREEYRSIVREKTTDEFIYWGRFIVMKNLTTLIRAFARAELPDSYTLTLIGDGPRRKEIEDLSRELGVSSRVKILPPLPVTQVLERGKNCRAFVLPSWTDISPNQVYESLAIGLPVLVTEENYLSVRDQFPETIDPNSADDIASKLKRLSDEKFYRDFAARFNSISFKNSWDDVLLAHERIFSKITGPKKELRVLQIGSDRTIFEGGTSAVRMRAYGEKFGKLDMIIFSLKKHGAKMAILSQVASAYPTNSFSRILYPLSAIFLGLTLPRPDVVSVQDPFEAGFAGWVIACLRGAPLHVQVHTDFLSPEFTKLSLLNKSRVFIAGFVLRRASRIRVVSARIKKSISERYKNLAPISVLPIFVDVERFRTSAADSALIAREHLFDWKFLVVSRLEPEKDVKLAISAFARAAVEKSCLIIIGGGSQLSELRDFAREKGVGKWVFFEGYTDPTRYYKIADLVLFPSRYDGYGMVIIEALAAGVPVLSTDVGIAREAGAIVVSRDEFPHALKKWSEGGPREGSLKNYPYKNFEEYVGAYCEDIRKTAR